MFILRTVFLFSLVTLSRSRAALKEDEMGKVIFVNVLHRHGDRTPTYFYPNDPYQNQSYWPEKTGQLTNTGKRQVFELGQWLRRRYEALLTERYSPDIIYMQSTDKDRTLMSAECVLAGMFPPGGAQVWDDDLPWQPIPVHTTPQRLDKVLGQPPRSPCPSYDEELHRVFTSDDRIKQLNETYSNLIQWTNENAGDNYTLMNLYLIYDTLFVESTNNMTLPAWTSRVYPEPMRMANVNSYMLVTLTPRLARLVTGLLIQNMIQNMVDKVQNKTTRSVHVYSAHDETITNILTALGAFNYILPPYASCLMLELRVDTNGNHYVSLYYRNSTTEAPYLMKVKGCAPMCPLDQFINISHPLIPEDWDQECALDDVNQKSYLSIVSVSVAVVVVILLVLVGVYYYCRRKPK